MQNSKLTAVLWAVAVALAICIVLYFVVGDESAKSYLVAGVYILIPSWIAVYFLNARGHRRSMGGIESLILPQGENAMASFGHIVAVQESTSAYSFATWIKMHRKFSLSNVVITDKRIILIDKTWGAVRNIFYKKTDASDKRSAVSFTSRALIKKIELADNQTVIKCIAEVGLLPREVWKFDSTEIFREASKYAQ